MNHQLKWIALTLLPLLAAACVPLEEKRAEENNGENNGECFAGCEEEPDPNVNKKPALEGVFVSGHLGNYYDCPEDGYVPDRTNEGVAPGDENSGDFAEGACAEGSDCPTINNCEPAQFTIQLTNSDDEDATAIQIETIDLLREDGTLAATLPLIDAQAVASGSSVPFDGNLAAGAVVTLRVDFQGPAHPWDLLAPADSSADRAFSDTGSLLITVAADDRGDTVIESTAVYSIPGVDT